jgi:hypothetical protein
MATANLGLTNDHADGDLIRAADINDLADGAESVYVTLQERAPAGYRSVSSTTTLDETDNLVDGNATGGAFTITLPAAADIPAGRAITVVKVDASGNAVSVARAGSDTINGAATNISISTQWAGKRFISNGVSAWRAL